MESLESVSIDGAERHKVTVVTRSPSPPQAVLLIVVGLLRLYYNGCKNAALTFRLMELKNSYELTDHFALHGPEFVCVGRENSFRRTLCTYRLEFIVN